MEIKSIGVVNAENYSFSIQLRKEFLKGLENIEGFSHLQVIWWGNLSDNIEDRKKLTTQKPYVRGPESLGVFATRSQMRPNPILITTIYVEHIDFENGIIHTPYIDAENQTPVLDIKPYHKLERVKNCQVPNWCSHWPEYYEKAGEFDWAAEFNFV